MEWRNKKTTDGKGYLKYVALNHFKYICLQRQHEKEEETQGTKRKAEKFVPNSNYKDKYAHLIGQDAALEAARKTETNKSYGFGKLSVVV